MQFLITISTIQQREYVEKGDKQGEKREFITLTLKGGKITARTKSETVGADKGKLIPTDIGVVVNEFLTKYFPNILDYNFTANVEKEFDKIAEGECKWNSMISDFYKDFHKQIEDTSDNSGKFSGEKLLGVDPASGKNVYVKIGRFGPVAQIGDTDSEEKPKFAGLNKNQSIGRTKVDSQLLSQRKKSHFYIVFCFCKVNVLLSDKSKKNILNLQSKYYIR